MKNLNLENLGITKQEFLVYQVILKSPTHNVTEISKEVGINRTTLYTILKSLTAKKLLVENKKSSSVKYNAVSPKSLLELAQIHQKEVANQLVELQKNIPYLNALANLENLRSDIDFFIQKGKEAIKTYNALLATAKSEITGFTFDENATIDDVLRFKNGKLVLNAYAKTVMKYGDKFVFAGTSKSIKKTASFFEIAPELKGKFQPRWLAPDEVNLKLNLYVFDDWVMLITRNSDKLIYFIRNIEIADSFKSLSLFLWKHANPIH